MRNRLQTVRQNPQEGVHVGRELRLALEGRVRMNGGREKALGEQRVREGPVGRARAQWEVRMKRGREGSLLPRALLRNLEIQVRGGEDETAQVSAALCHTCPSPSSLRNLLRPDNLDAPVSICPTAPVCTSVYPCRLASFAYVTHHRLTYSADCSHHIF